MAHSEIGISFIPVRTKAMLLIAVFVGFLAAAGCEKKVQESENKKVSEVELLPTQSPDSEDNSIEIPSWVKKVIQDAKGVETKTRNALNKLDTKIEKGSSDPEDYYQRGKLRYRLRQFVGFRQKLDLDQKALQDFEKAHKLAGADGHPLALLRAASVHLGRFEFYAAEKYVRRAEAIDPDNILVHIKLAVLNGLYTDEWDEPIVTLLALAERSDGKDSLRAWSSLGYAYYHAKRYEDALSAYRRCVELQPSIQVLGNLGLVYSELGQHKLAQRLMETILVSDPSDVYAGINLASMLVNQYDPEKSREAIRVLRAVLDLAPTIPAAWHNLGLAYSGIGDYGKSIDAYQRAVDLFPKFVDSHYNMGIINDEWGRYSEAIGAYEKALQYSPNPAKILYNLGLAYVHSQQFQDAERIFIRLTEITPGDHRVWNTLGHILLNQRKHEEARPAFERALAIDPKLVRPRNGLGAVKLNARDFEGAIECFLRVISEHEDDSGAVTGIIEVMLRHTDLKYALQIADDLVKRLPKSSGPLMIRANIQLRTNRNDGVIADCTHAIKINDKLSEAYVIRGIAYILERDYTVAVKDLKQAKTLNPDATYATLWNWPVLMALGKADTARHELAAATENVKHDSWEGNLLRFLQGQESPDDLLKLAQNDERRCEAYYYIGERILNEGNVDEANDWFKKCLETKIPYYLEPLLAQRHLNND